MEALKGLHRYQKYILLLMLAMALVFAAVYSATIRRVGFSYKDTIFVPRQENGGTVYAGKLQGQPADFTVTADKTVVFACGGRTYGPYTAAEDPAAVPKNDEMPGPMTGVELRRGGDVLFRGGVLAVDDHLLLFNADGTSASIGIAYMTGDGIMRGENGEPLDLMEPSASVILTLMKGPTLTHKGEWAAWFGAVLICLLNAVSILFADRLFRWGLAFRIRDADRAEPSDWEIAGRYVTWTVLPVLALVIFVMGLR